MRSNTNTTESDDAARALAWAAEQSNDPDPSAMDALSLYTREIAAYPLLSADEERALFARLARHPGDTATRTRLVESNLRLVVWVSGRYRNALRRGGMVDVMDLIQQGNDGLLHAVEMFNPRCGTKFSTYAVRWIVQRMGRARDEDAAAVHVPTYVRDAQRKIVREWAQLTVQLGREPTAAEKKLAAAGAQADLAAYGRAVPDEYLAAAAVTRGAFSLDAPLPNLGREADPVTLADLLPDPDGGEGVAGALDAAQEAWLAQQVARICTPRECQVIGYRYGRGYTLEQTGRELRVTRERVRQIEAKALEKLRTALTQDRETGGAVPKPTPRAKGQRSTHEQLAAARESIFALLDTNPHYSAGGLASAAGICEQTAAKFLRAWRVQTYGRAGASVDKPVPNSMHTEDKRAAASGAA